MAIMQDWPVLTRKIAKMQDGIILRQAQYGQWKMTLTRIRTSNVVLIGGGQNVRHYHAENQKCRMHT